MIIFLNIQNDNNDLKLTRTTEELNLNFDHNIF